MVSALSGTTHRCLFALLSNLQQRTPKRENPAKERGGPMKANCLMNGSSFVVEEKMSQTAGEM
jgi:hypothetical protein